MPCGPVCFFFKLFSVSGAKGYQLLFDLLQLLLAVISHTDIFLDCIIVIIWNIYGAVSAVSKAFGNLLSIASVCFDPILLTDRHSCRSQNDTLDANSFQPMVQRISRQPAL